MHICFDTFGCRLNKAEALGDEARCIAKGHRIVDSHAEADLVIVRGCSVTARAQRECEALVKHLRKHYPNKRVIVTGCLPGAQKLNIDPSGRGGASAKKASPVPMRTSRAYLKVQDGCSRGCAFCIVPKFRGAPVSVPFDTAMDSAKRFIDAGYSEIILTGCNLALYSDGSRRLPDLAAAIAEAFPGGRVRLGSVEPGPCADELVDAMAGHENICRSLHLSVQSGSDRILTLMRRRYTAGGVAELAAKARRLMPLLGLGCDLIAGFPGETEGDFRETKRLVVRCGFTNVHAFPFSERPGTAAATLPGRILPEIRHARARELAAAAKEALRRFAANFTGKTVQIAVESVLPAAGWTSEHLWLEERLPPPSIGHAQAEALRRSLISFKVRTVKDGVLRGDRLAGRG